MKAYVKYVKLSPENVSTTNMYKYNPAKKRANKKWNVYCCECRRTIKLKLEFSQILSMDMSEWISIYCKVETAKWCMCAKRDAFIVLFGKTMYATFTAIRFHFIEIQIRMWWNIKIEYKNPNERNMIGIKWNCRSSHIVYDFVCNDKTPIGNILIHHFYWWIEMLLALLHKFGVFT